MKTLKASPDTLVTARKMAQRIGVLRNSITNGEGNFIAALGELAVKRLVRGYWVGHYQYDVLSEEGEKLEVKSVKTTVVPKPHYRVHVCAHNDSQDCDYYVFTRVWLRDDGPVVYVLGKLTPAEFFAKAEFRSRGEKEPGTGWEVKEDSWSVRIEELEEL